MKTDNSIRDYYYMNVLNEGLSELLKGFWDWLTGKYNKKEYDPNNDAFDYDTKVKYINKHKVDSFTTEEINDSRILKKVIERTVNTNDTYKGFENSNNLINKNKELGKITSSNKWMSFIFHGKNLVDNACLIAFRLNDSEFPNSIVIYFSEILSEYNKILNNEFIIEELQKLKDKYKISTIILKDKRLINRFKEDKDLELTEYNGKKNIYQL